MISSFWRDLVFRPVLKGRKIEIGPWALFREGYQVRSRNWGCEVLKVSFSKPLWDGTVTWILRLNSCLALQWRPCKRSIWQCLSEGQELLPWLPKDIKNLVEQFKRADSWSLFARRPLQVLFSFRPWGGKNHSISFPSRIEKREYYHLSFLR